MDRVIEKTMRELIEDFNSFLKKLKGRDTLIGTE